MALLLFFFTIFSVFAAAVTALVTGDLILEEGYTVTTVLDGRKTNPAVNPFLIIPKQRSRDDLIVLDSAASALFLVSLPGDIRLIVGGSRGGFRDGTAEKVLFDRPRSVAVDGADNVYVADRSNRAIRKVNSDGFTTTIAGGYSDKTGHVDGPAQNASFSTDFELVYAPKICALLISDRGNQLIRQINLKKEDCTEQASSALGAIPASVLAVICVLIGSLLGFIVQPFLVSHEVFSNLYFSRTWKHFSSNMRNRILITFFVIRSAAAKCTPVCFVYKLLALTLNHVLLVYRNLRPGNRIQYRSVETVSLLNSDMTYEGPSRSSLFADQLTELISFDESNAEASATTSNKIDDHVTETFEVGLGSIDDMMIANLVEFADPTIKQTLVKESVTNSSGLVKRKPNKDAVLPRGA